MAAGRGLPLIGAARFSERWPVLMQPKAGLARLTAGCAMLALCLAAAATWATTLQHVDTHR